MTLDNDTVEAVEAGTVTANDVFKILNHPVRRTMIRLLHERVNVSYSELLRDLGIDEGQFNFHLRLVKKLTEETRDGRYTLSHLGRTAYNTLLSVEKEFEGKEEFFAQPVLSWGLVSRRVGAFAIDVLIFLTFTGAIFDPFLWQWTYTAALHAASVFDLNPWFFHPEHIPEIGAFVYRLIEGYSHIFFAVFIAFTLMDAYRGQTPGRYLMGIRVVSVSNRKLDLIEAAIRNMGKVFLLPLDLIAGLTLFRKRGYIKFCDYYTQSKVERVRVTPLEPEKQAVEPGSLETASGY